MGRIWHQEDITTIILKGENSYEKTIYQTGSPLPCKSAGAVVEFMVSQGGHIASQGAQHPQFRGVCVEYGLDQGAHGEVACIEA